MTNEYLECVKQDLKDTIRITRTHGTYISIDELAEALVDSFGEESRLVAHKMLAIAEINDKNSIID